MIACTNAEIAEKGTSSKWSIAWIWSYLAMRKSSEESSGES